jgi:hypothetical protein
MGLLHNFWVGKQRNRDKYPGVILSIAQYQNEIFPPKAFRISRLFYGVLS